MDVERLDCDIEHVDDLETVSITVETTEAVSVIDPGSLKPLAEIRDHAPSVDPREIATALEYPVGTFDGEPLYHGRVDGTELSYDVTDAEDETPILIVSFGEVQPGRYGAAAEAVVRTSSDRS